MPNEIKSENNVSPNRVLIQREIILKEANRNSRIEKNHK